MLIQFITPDFEFSDIRGSLTQLVHSGWNQVNFITSKSGALRGNHFHKDNTEAFFVISGKFTLFLEDVFSKKQEQYTIEAGMFFKILPNIAHSFNFIEDTSLISLYNRGVEFPDGRKDIHNY